MHMYVASGFTLHSRSAIGILQIILRHKYTLKRDTGTYFCLWLESASSARLVHGYRSSLPTPSQGRRCSSAFKLKVSRSIDSSVHLRTSEYHWFGTGISRFGRFANVFCNWMHYRDGWWEKFVAGGEQTDDGNPTGIAVLVRGGVWNRISRDPNNYFVCFKSFFLGYQTASESDRLQIFMNIGKTGLRFNDRIG